MATVVLTLDVPADGVTGAGAIRGYNDHLTEGLLRQDRTGRIEAMLIDGNWLSLESWQAAGNPPFQRVRVRVVFEHATELSPRVVAQLTNTIRAILENNANIERNINSSGPAVTLERVNAR